MITTTYICDRHGCGHKQPTAEQMWHVAAVCYPLGGQPPSYSHRGMKLWCRSCVDQFQLIKDPPPATAGEPATPELSLEDKIREIVRTMIDEEAGRG